MGCIMDQNSLYQKNLKFLKAHASEKTVDAINNSSADVLQVDDSKTPLVFSQKDQHDNYLVLHSKRRPVEEAQRQIDNWLAGFDKIEVNSTIFVLGLAGLFHIQALVEALDQEVTIAVIEPNPAVAREVAKFVDFESLTTNKKHHFFFIIQDDTHQFYNELMVFMSTRPRADHKIFIHPSQNRLHPKFCKEVSERILESARQDVMMRKTEISFTADWIKNSMWSLKRMTRSASIDVLKDRYKGAPGFVVAAGPSLDDTIAVIQKYHKKAVIITVGHALRRLNTAGINPHGVTVIDANPIVLNQFAQTNYEETFLFSAPHVNSLILEQFEDRFFSFSTVTVKQTEEWMRNFLEPAANMHTAGTVTVNAISIAAYLGCDDIYTFGLDLAFSPDGVAYASNSWEFTDPDEDKNHHKNYVERSNDWVKGNFHESLRTSPQMKTYIDFVANYARHIKPDGKRIINVNTGGAFIPDLDLKRPEEINLDAMPDTVDIFEDLHHLATEKPRGSVDETQKFLEKTRSKLGGLREDALEAQKMCDFFIKAHRAGEAVAESKLKKMDKLERRIKDEKNPAVQLANEAIRLDCRALTNNLSLISKGDAKEFERVHEEAGRFYGDIAEKALWLQKMLNEVLKEFKKP